MSNVTEQWNLRLMGTERDVSTHAMPTVWHAILLVPRSGSTLVARGLEATRKMGVPHECLNPNAMKAWSHLGGHGGGSLEEYRHDGIACRDEPMMIWSRNFARYFATLWQGWTRRTQSRSRARHRNIVAHVPWETGDRVNAPSSRQPEAQKPA
jgi:hypothetical protein